MKTDKTHYFAAVMLVALAALSAGCRKSNTNSGVSAPTSSAAPSAVQPDLNHPEGGTAVLAETKYFKGSIGDALDLQMKLIRSGDQLNGSYSYQKIGTKISLRGTVDKEGHVSIDEFDPAGKQTGLFKGFWKTEAADGLVTIAGNWSKPVGEKTDDKKTAFSVHEEPISLTGDSDFVTKQIKESNKKLVYEITAQYPQITGSSNANFEKFNQAARSLVTKTVADFKKDMALETGEEQRPENSMGSSLDISYKIALAQDDLVSMSVAVASYYQGAAHPNSYSDSLNYDLKNAKVLKLADLFKPGAKYLPSLATYCIADLKKQSSEKGLDDSSINTGAGPTAKNYRSWTISKQGLGVNFDAYQVGPYAAGPQFVLVPYSAIKDLINPEGPIGQFAK